MRELLPFLEHPFRYCVEFQVESILGTKCIDVGTNERLVDIAPGAPSWQGIGNDGFGGEERGEYASHVNGLRSDAEMFTNCLPGAKHPFWRVESGQWGRASVLEVRGLDFDWQRERASLHTCSKVSGALRQGRGPPVLSKSLEYNGSRVKKHLFRERNNAAHV